MAILQKFVAWEVVIILGGLFVGLAYQLLTKRINLQGLFVVKDHTNESSPARVQLLFSSVAFAMYYLAKVVHAPTRFPEIPHEILYSLGASHSVYLTAKSKAIDRLTSGL